MADVKPTSRRDMREARGYLTDLFDAVPDEVRQAGKSLEWVADHLIAHTARINVQRATDMLVLYFDLTDEGESETIEPDAA